MKGTGGLGGPVRKVVESLRGGRRGSKEYEVIGMPQLGSETGRREGSLPIDQREKSEGSWEPGGKSSKPVCMRREKACRSQAKVGALISLKTWGLKLRFSNFGPQSLEGEEEK